MSLRHSDTAWSLRSDHIINSLTFIYIPTWVCNTLRSPHKMIWAIIRHLSLTIEYLREFVTHWGPNNMVEVHVIFTHTYWSYTLRSPHTIDSLTHTYRGVLHTEVPTHNWFINTYLQVCVTHWGPHTRLIDWLTHTYRSVGHVEVPTHDDWLFGVQLLQVISEVAVPLFCPILQTNQTFTRIWHIWNWSSLLKTNTSIALHLYLLQ